MQITDVRVRKVAKEGKLKAVVSITMQCLARRQQTVNIGMLRIQSTLAQESGFRA